MILNLNVLRRNNVLFIIKLLLSRNFVFYDKFKYSGDVLPILFMCLLFG